MSLGINQGLTFCPNTAPALSAQLWSARPCVFVSDHTSHTLHYGKHHNSHTNSGWDTTLPQHQSCGCKELETVAITNYFLFYCRHLNFSRRIGRWLWCSYQPWMTPLHPSCSSIIINFPKLLIWGKPRQM